MMTDSLIAQGCPLTVAEALVEILGGKTANELESSTLDFKEDPAHRSREGTDAKAVEMLVNEAICLANGTAGDAYIVLGVADKVPGAAALTGTHRDPRYLEKKIFDTTKPNLRVEASAVSIEEANLIIVRVPAVLAVYGRTNGAASHRVGTECKPLDEDTRRRLYYQRANPDFTAQSSRFGAEDLDPEALAAARDLIVRYRSARGDTSSALVTTGEMLRTLDLGRSDGMMTLAAEILFHRHGSDRPHSRYFYRNTPMGQPTVTDFNEPLVIAARRLHELVRVHSDVELARVDLGMGPEAAVPLFPSRAVDEAITNALVHRDWAMMEPVVVDQSALVLKVQSPGGLPSGVDSGRLLSTQSRPRNPCLMNAMRVLGLVEQTSQGFDRMWLSMLTSGRDVPEVEAGAGSVAVTFFAGAPDKEFIQVLNRVNAQLFPGMLDDVACVLIFRHLTNHSVLSLSVAAALLQMPEGEARQIMVYLVQKNLVSPIDERRDEWTLSEAARALTRPMLSVPLALPNVQKWIEERIFSGQSVTNKEISKATEAPSRDVTAVLQFLLRSGVVKKDPAGPSRGSGVRWIRS